MDRCVNCERMVDTDDDAEFYDDDKDGGMCEPCREKVIAGQMEDQRLDDPRRH
jgi:hypothetical protein